MDQLFVGMDQLFVGTMDQLFVWSFFYTLFFALRSVVKLKCQFLIKSLDTLERQALEHHAPHKYVLNKNI